MNWIWAGMILTGIVYGIVTGNLQEVTDGVLLSAQEAVSLCIRMCGIMAFWTGLMEIAKKAGLIRQMTKGLKPFLHFMFPDIPKDHPAGTFIAMNMIANFLGLGWAATPAGLKAMEELEDLKKQEELEKQEDLKKQEELERWEKQEQSENVSVKRSASNEMCTFLILNISSLQLIPLNIIAYRSQYGSVNPTAVVGPGIAATVVSTLVAVLFCKIMCRRKHV